MKIIALMPVKNESWILPVTLPQTAKFVDEMVFLDTGSIDNAWGICKNFGYVIPTPHPSPPNFSVWRHELLLLGRTLRGTHFVFVDADETLPTNLLPTWRSALGKMKPGDKMIFDWYSLWKNPNEHRVDGIWGKLQKDVVFCDDGVSDFGGTPIDEPRTPPSKGMNHFPPKAVLLHYQFVPYERYQLKQAYRRCLELTMGQSPWWAINEKYAFTSDRDAVVMPVPAEITEGITGVEKLYMARPESYLREIEALFLKHGPKFFERLDIFNRPPYPKPSKPAQLIQRAFYKAKRMLA